MEALRKPVRVSGLAVAIVLLALFAAPAVRADVGMPSWSAGDFWQYSITGGTFTGGGSGTTGTWRYDVLGPDTVTVAGVSYPAYHLKLTLNRTEGSSTFTYLGDAWFRTADLAVAKLAVSATIFGTTVTVTMTFNPPQGIQWPLVAGRAWNSATEVTIVTTGFGTNTDTYADTGSFTVQASQTVAVTAGTFDTMPVRETHAGGGYDITYWSQSAGNPAREEAYDSNNQPMGSQQLTSYRYSGGLGAILWIVILLLIVIVAVVVVGLLMRSRGRRTGAVMPPSMPPGQLYAQAPGYQAPQQPWQPPQQPWQPPPPGR